MVYEKECVECGKIIDFGGEDPEKLPDNAIEFNDDIYCRECVKRFVEFGTGDIIGRIKQIEEAIENIEDELGLQKHLEI